MVETRLLYKFRILKFLDLNVNVLPVALSYPYFHTFFLNKINRRCTLRVVDLNVISITDNNIIQNEVNIMKNVNHANVVAWLGTCLTEKNRIMVTEYFEVIVLT